MYAWLERNNFRVLLLFLTPSDRSIILSRSVDFFVVFLHLIIFANPGFDTIASAVQGKYSIYLISICASVSNPAIKTSILNISVKNMGD